MPWMPVFERPLPPALEGLRALAYDLRWTGSQGSDLLWQRLAPEMWERTENPLLVLQTASDKDLAEAAGDEALVRELNRTLQERQRMLDDPGWFAARYGDHALKSVAYFSMEFGLSEALPIYAGGLGILAGDLLKTASDMGVPVTGIGLLYDQGYFQQQLTPDGWQLEANPYNDPINLPLTPTPRSDGGWLTVALELPGRTLRLRVWQAQVGQVTLYLLDSNHPQNSPWDRAITSELYSGGQETRILQELALGIGGWSLLQALGVDVDICHLNEGHAAFVVLARARQYMEQKGVGFDEALWATRAGNLFTTHTPVAAGFDRFDESLVRRYLTPLAGPVPVDAILAMGGEGWGGPFNMAFFATRGSGAVNAVSRLHGSVSQEIFRPLFPRWPLTEVPVGYVTNGVHVDSWDSDAARALWGSAGAQSGGQNTPEANPVAPGETAAQQIAVGDRQLFDYRQSARQTLVDYVRRRLARQYQAQGLDEAKVAAAQTALDPETLTLGFARRFAAYKRPGLILHDLDRLTRILTNSKRPVQLIVAGKAHPGDNGGKHLVQQMVQTAARPDLAGRLVFLADYDMALTQQLAAGVDVWINTPRRPMEACGTSGMKLLVNGGLNLSELDGWWAEAYSPEVGWALGDGQEHPEGEWDAHEADQLYNILENEVVPLFYDRDEAGLPQAWLTRVRASMSRLTPQFSGPRMLGEYVTNYYVPGAETYHKRVADDGGLAHDILEWQQRLDANWPHVGFANLSITDGDPRTFTVEISLSGLSPDDVSVELYAEPVGDGSAEIVPMARQEPVGDTGATFRYAAQVSSERQSQDYTPRIVPAHPDVAIPLEAGHIAWMK